MSRGELPQSRLTPRQLPQGVSLWHGGKVFGRIKGPIPEDDFPRPGQILPAPGRNVTAGDKERNRCRVATKRGIWQSRQALTGGVFPATDPTRENAMPGGPQTARHCSIINNSSAEYAQSTTTTTAASGGNREELLGQRPARRKCRPRHDADAGCRNPIAERIPIVFLRTAPLPPDAPVKRTAMPRRTGSPP